AIIHLAAVADVSDVLADPVRSDRINVHGTQTILEAARHNEIERVVYGSTVWVYGNAPADGVLDEESPLSLPRHLYTATKMAAEVPIVHGPERPVDVRIPTISGARAAAELGWQPRIQFAEGVGRYLDWLSETSGSPVWDAVASTERTAAAVFRQES